MRRARSGTLTAILVGALCLPASAGDLCDAVRAMETRKVKLFSQTITKYSGIFAKSDCKYEAPHVVCRRDYTRAGATELFGSTSGMAVAGIVGASLDQCGFAPLSEDVEAADDPPEDRLYITTYQLPSAVGQPVISDILLRIIVRAKKKSQGIRITLIAANISDE